ncbi:MAG: alpha-mannosidase [Ruminococcaceae bacterium]|nr:alpha-mannosidase [Oscillospiraceae bacterium]
MKKVHLIGNAHLDPVWLWQWQEGFAEIKATFRSALDRMKEFEDFKFTSACGAYYMWIEQSDPAMFEEIRARVREGRWCLVGGWIIQPDCNIPCGESFARHALITQRYFQEKFGRMAETGYNVDSFGHNGSLPMILRQSRMKNYVFMRPSPAEKALPSHLFRWESADGSRVNTYRVPHRYNIDGMRNNRGVDRFGQIAELAAAEDNDQMAFYGVGNHGGGPTVSLLKRMHEELSEQFVYSDPDSYFAAQEAENAPIVRDDLQYHAKGCYSACSAIKKGNRGSENALLAAERLAVLSAQLTGAAYPAADLQYAWKRVLFNQFHDILGGCSIREAYDDAAAVHGEATAIAERVKNYACQQISWQVDTLAGNAPGHVSEADADAIGYPVVVFNPLDYEVEAPVHIRKSYQRVADAQGRTLPSQQVRDSKTNHLDKYATLFTARVPALGYALYRMFRTADEPMAENPLTVTARSMENGRLRVVFSPNGELCSLYDKRTKTELLAAPTELALYNDEKNDTWAHGEQFFKDRVDYSVAGSVKIIEEGPVRAAICTEQHFGDSHIIRDYYLYAEGEAVEVKVRIDFREKFRVLKFRFPLTGADHKAYGKIPYGFIERPTDGSEQVCGDWIVMRGTSGGIGIANDCKHSFEADGNALSLTVLRSALYADHFGVRDEFCEFMEQGEHRFAYSVFPLRSISDAQHRAEALQQPLIAVPETFHAGALPTGFAGMWLSAENVSVTAIKQHTDSAGIILRCYETAGKDTDVILRLFDTEHRFSISHHAVKTLLWQDGCVTETDFIE